jgi:hypothetical protein
MKLIYVIAFLFGAARIAGVIWPMDEQLQNLFKSSAHLYVGGLFGAWAALRWANRHVWDVMTDSPRFPNVHQLNKSIWFWNRRSQLWYTAWALSLLELAAFIWSKWR